MSLKLHLFLSLIVLMTAGCGPILGGIRADKGAFAVEGWVGGPVVEYAGAPIPLPLSAVGARYGLTDNLDVGLHWHATALAAGVAAADADLRLSLDRGRYLSDARLRLNYGYGQGAGYGAIEASYGGRYQVLPTLWLGAGLHLLQAFDNSMIPTPTFALGLGGQRWGLEARAYSVNQHHTANPIEYPIRFPSGVFGLFFTYGWAFND